MPSDARLTTTYSMWNLFRNCRRACYWRYVKQIVPLADDERSLRFGSVVHQGLEVWHGGAGLDAVLAQIDRSFINRASDPVQKQDWHYARAMMTAYASRYTEEAWDVVALEREFTGEIVNPTTGAHSKSFVLAGKVDGVIKKPDGTYHLLEHKCLASGSRIFDYRRGRLMRVEDMARDGIAPLILGYDVEARQLKLAQAMVPKPESVRPMCAVTLRSGRTLRVSENHPIWTRRGWVPAAELLSSDSVGVPERTGGYSLPTSPLTDHEVRFVGYMLGDGCFSNMRFTKTNAAVRADLRASLDGMGVSHRLEFRPDRAPNVCIERAQSSAAVALCERLELRGTAVEKHLPDEAYGVTDQQIGILLGALWATDGCIDLFREEREGMETQYKIRIAYCSRSRQLCDDVQRLLLRLGFWSTFTESSVLYEGQRLPYFTTKVVGREMKRRFLRAILDGTIPMLRSRDVARRALAAVKPGNFERDVVAQDGIFWDRVKSIEIGHETLMYDLSVPDLHTFVVDDVVTHNTSSTIDGDYVGKLWTDLQITLYSHYLREALGIPIEGVIYNVLAKPKLVQSAGETEDEFQERLSALAAKNKSGKSNATRRLPESDDAFAERLAAWYAEKDRFLRVELVFDFEAFALLRSELWELTQQYLDARRRETWYLNTDYCFRWQRPCPYYAICCSKDNPLVIENQYREKPAHSELSAASVSESNPVF